MLVNALKNVGSFSCLSNLKHAKKDYVIQKNESSIKKSTDTIKQNRDFYYFSSPAFKGCGVNEYSCGMPYDSFLGVDLDEIIDTSLKEENIIGQGANSTVYNIPKLDDYVLKVLNKDDPNKIDMNEFPKNSNLGQPVFQFPDNPRMLILKKIEGQEHSISNWSRTIWDDEIKSPLNVTLEQSKTYFKKVDELAKMPQSAFDDLACDVKILSDKHYKLDSINPNNLIVDFDKQKIHIIDYFKVKENERDIYQNSSLDLSAVMLDFTLLDEYFDNLSNEEQKKLLSDVKTIYEKNELASKKAGLSTDREKFIKYIRTTSKWFCARSVEKPDGDGLYYRYYDIRAEKFLNLLDELEK